MTLLRTYTQYSKICESIRLVKEQDEVFLGFEVEGAGLPCIIYLKLKFEFEREFYFEQSLLFPAEETEAR